jgi:type IV pilus assembly protein PilM
MAKKEAIIGISVNHGNLSLTLLKAGQVVKTFWEEIPENIVEGTKIISSVLFAEFLQDKLKTNGIKCKKAAYTIADEDIFIKNLSMPNITDEQLRYNIPFEFNDYIHGELKDYIFDFIKRDTTDDLLNNQIKLLAYAVPAQTIASLQQILQMAGLKLVKVLPETIAYEALLEISGREKDERVSRCFLDIGRKNIRMMIFKNGEFSLSHQIDTGENHAINVIADELGVDSHLANTYLRTNHNDCNRKTSVVNAFKDMSLEILKGLNYYEMSDMTSKLSEVILCGTGALTEPLVEILKERIDKNVYTMDEFLSEYTSEKEINVTYASVGTLLSKAPGIAGDGSSAQADKRKKVNLKILIPAAVLCLLVVGAAAKFVIYDQFALLAKEFSTSKQLSDQLEEKNNYIKAAGDLVDEYSHYTWDGMTEEEKTRVKRTKTAELVDYISTQGIDVENFSITGTVVTINIHAPSLESVSKLLETIKDQEIVESSSVAYAATKEKEEMDETSAIYYVGNGVEAQINIYLAGSGE